MRFFCKFFLVFNCYFLSVYSQSDFIVGGNDADIQDYPYQVALLSTTDWGGSYAYCGGSIINEYWVLTAAHCVIGESASNTAVRMGSEANYAEGGNTYDADEIIIHPDYNSNTYNNDIALIKLENPISFNNSAQPVLLMCDSQVEQGVQEPGEMSWITGWGETEGTTSSTQLQVVSVPITASSNYGINQIDADMIMAGYSDGGYDSCQGDSGGPMVVLASDGQTFLQSGIVSWGYGCAEVGYPGVYSRVSYFIDWICDKTDGAVCSNQTSFCNEDAVYGCTDSSAINFNSDADYDDGSCQYLCDQTILLTIEFDCWSEEIGWSINNEEGAAVAIQSSGFYDTELTTESICLSFGCYTFNIFDSYGDGLGGSQWSSCNINGSYNISLLGEVLFSGGGDFGSSADHDFCINTVVYGCTDLNACNYNEEATEEDGSCLYPIEFYNCSNECITDLDSDGVCDELEVFGCSDTLANNYNPEVTEDNGSCIYPQFGCTDLNACNYNEEATEEDGTCIYPIEFYNCSNECITDLDSDGVCDELEVFGCSDILANNYNPEATEDDGSCEFETYNQLIALQSGWGIWSTYIDPSNANMSSVFSEINNELIIIKDENGSVYWPQYNLNSIGSLQKGAGYQIKMNNDAILSINGDLVQSDYVIPLESGWNMLGYLHGECNNTTDMMIDIANDIVIVKDENGLVYWPEFGLNSIGELCPGKGYQIKLNNDLNFNYPSISGRYGELNKDYNTYYPDVYNTGNNMTLLFPFETINHLLTEYDEIAVYSKNDLCVGSAVYKNEHLVLTAWGDDMTTLSREGLLVGEDLFFKYWDFETQLEYSFDVIYKEGSGLYAINGISIVSQIIFNHTENIPANLIKIIDYLGRELNNKSTYNIQLHIYNDGSIIKNYK